MVKHGDGSKVVFVDDTYKIRYFSDNFDYSRAKIIEDENVMNGIKHILEKLRFKYIFYSGGEVSFTRTSNHMGKQQRIINVISSDRYNEIDVEILQIEDNWFYYEDK